MTGLSIDDQRRAAGLKPLPHAQRSDPKPEHGHGRGKTAPPKADKTDIGLRGVPVIGHGAGAIAGSAPGGEMGAAKRLDQAGQDIVASRMRAARDRLKQGPKQPTTDVCG